MMNRYMLLTFCSSSGIEDPKFFVTQEEAVNSMCADVADFIGLTPEEVAEARLEGKMIDNYTCVGEFYAWSDRHESCDWRITEIDYGED